MKLPRDVSAPSLWYRLHVHAMMRVRPSTEQMVSVMGCVRKAGFARFCICNMIDVPGADSECTPGDDLYDWWMRVCVAASHETRKLTSGVIT